MPGPAFTLESLPVREAAMFWPLFPSFLRSVTLFDSWRGAIAGLSLCSES